MSLAQGTSPGLERLLPLDERTRGRLGLAPEERLRVLDVGLRTVLLERTSGPESSALPWDLDLVLTGDVRAFSLADLLGLVHVSRKSGFLYFTQREHAKSIYLHHGEVVFATSNQRVDRLGECLLRAGVIQIDQLREAERRFEGEGRFGKVLVERGFLTPRELWNGVKYQVEEIVRSLFSYTAGTVYFWEGEVQPDNVVRLSLPTARLAAEGIQRRDELLRFLSVLEDPRVRLKPLLSARSKLAGAERALFDALESHASFHEVRRHLQMDALTAARTLQLLRLVGAVQIARSLDEDAFVGEADLHSGEDDELVRECVGTHVKLLGELAAPLVALEGSERLVERLQPVLSEIRGRHPELLRGIELGPHAEIDPGILIQRALRLPAPRLLTLSSALGELVAYLEFELKNHPRIPDADDFLSGLESLRAAIST
jgi:hypothetical protein